jgi:hypothetical protein
MSQGKKGVFYVLKYCFCKTDINELNYFKCTTFQEAKGI